MKSGRQFRTDHIGPLRDQPLTVPVALPLGRRVDEQRQVGLLRRIGHDATQRGQMRLEEFMHRAVFVGRHDRVAGDARNIAAHTLGLNPACRQT